MWFLSLPVKPEQKASEPGKADCGLFHFHIVFVFVTPYLSTEPTADATSQFDGVMVF